MPQKDEIVIFDAQNHNSEVAAIVERERNHMLLGQILPLLVINDVRVRVSDIIINVTKSTIRTHFPVIASETHVMSSIVQAMSEEGFLPHACVYNFRGGKGYRNLRITELAMEITQGNCVVVSLLMDATLSEGPMPAPEVDFGDLRPARLATWNDAYVTITQHGRDIVQSTGVRSIKLTVHPTKQMQDWPVTGRFSLLATGQDSRGLIMSWEGTKPAELTLFEEGVPVEIRTGFRFTKWLEEINWGIKLRTMYLSPPFLIAPDDGVVEVAYAFRSDQTKPEKKKELHAGN